LRSVCESKFCSIIKTFNTVNVTFLCSNNKTYISAFDSTFVKSIMLSFESSIDDSVSAAFDAAVVDSINDS